jgi:hypothetical protein
MKLKIFFSWQKETDNQGFHNKPFLLKCINKAVKELCKTKDFKNIDFEIMEGMRNIPGHPSVADKMFEQIDKCDIFIGDVTICQKIPFWANMINKFVKRSSSFHQDVRLSCNTNVYGEFNRALARYKFEDQTVLVMNTVNGDPHENSELISFDTRDRRFPITFLLKDDSKESIDKAIGLTNNIKDAIRLAALAAIQNKADRYHPFVGWKNCANQYLTNYFWNKELETVKSHLISDKIVRLLGVSGLGKTRLVYESFREEQYSQNFLYCDCQINNKDKILNAIYTVSGEFPEATLALDNCSKEDFNHYRELWRSKKIPNRLIAIYNDPLEYEDNSDFVVIKLDPNLDDIVERLLNILSNLTIDQRQRIKDFAGGIPMMAELLVDKLKHEKPLTDFEDDSLVTKILDVNKGSDERLILQSLSLFDYVGYRDERRCEVEYIATNKDITSINIPDQTVLMNKVDAVISKCLSKKILDRQGRTIGIRPVPLAMYLIAEWIRVCTSERLYKVALAIKNAPNSSLLQAFSAQFKYLDHNRKAIELLNIVLDNNGPFADAKVINTEAGSQLLRTFTEVNPLAVSKLLFHVLSNLSIHEISTIVDGRRNLVWLLEKLCFYEQTFNDGTYLMMRFAIAENETISNNATNQFIRLFSAYLPGTSVPLEPRICFLESHISSKENISIILKALKRALSLRDFIYIGGAEELGLTKSENYRPQSYSEIKGYLHRCLALLMKIYDSYKDEIDVIKSIFEDNIVSLYMSGYGELVYPYVLKIAEIASSNWDKMWQTLSMFKDRIRDIDTSETYKKYSDLIEKLTKNDIISRFKAIEKINRIGRNKSFQEIVLANQNDYANLAIEFINNGYTKEQLKQFIEVTDVNSYPFGCALAKSIDESKYKTILIDAIDIINTSSHSNPQILLDFISQFNEAIFAQTFDTIKTINNKSLIFRIVGSHALTIDNRYFDYLKELIDTNQAELSNFKNFYTSLNLITFSVDEIIKFFNVISSYPNSVSTIVDIFSFDVCFSQTLSDEMCKVISNYLKEKRDCLFIYNNSDVFTFLSYFLEKYNDPELAHDIIESLLNYISTTNSLMLSYCVTELFSTLVSKYMPDVWPSLSSALLSDTTKSMLFYQLKYILYNQVDNICLIDIHTNRDLLINWCSTYPDAAPERLMSIIPWGNGDKFDDLVLYLIDNYGSNFQLLENLSCQMDSIASTGSIVPVYMSRKKACETLLKHKNEIVRLWAKKCINHYDSLISKYSDFEAEEHFN